MGISSRIGEIFRANINDLIDRAENPEKMIKQIIQDMQKELLVARQALGKAMASERMAEQQRTEAAEQAVLWEERARAAAGAGALQVAREALAQKIRAEESGERYQAQQAVLSRQTEELRVHVELLQEKLTQARQRQAVLLARSQMAESRKQLAVSVQALEAADAGESFRRMEEQVLQKEAEAEVLAGTGSGADTYRADARVDEALQRLLAELGQAETDAGADAGNRNPG